MKKYYNYILLIIFCFTFLTCFYSTPVLKTNFNNKKFDNKVAFWSNQAKGANIFNRKVTREIIKAAKEKGIKFIRLAPDKFLSKERDFLLGNADNYKGLVYKDLKYLKEVLNICSQEKMPVVLTMLSLPGSRWKQNNNNVDDLRIWKNENFQNQAVKFWKDLAKEFKYNEYIVGYNILNEHHPERLYDSKSISIHNVNQIEVQEILHKFYENVIRAIREVDTYTPIILDSSSYGDPQTFKHFKIIEDSNVFYSFHMYEPYNYTSVSSNKNGKFSYPGDITNNDEIEWWDKEKLRLYMEPVMDFQKKYNIPSNRIIVGEFGGYRKVKGLENYFSDLISIFNQYKWHFAFYAFREDAWDGMDYEIGVEDVPWTYWKEIEEGKEPKVLRHANPIFDVLKKGLE